MPPRPPYPPNERERLEALRRYRILDTGPEAKFDRIANVARQRFKVPVALVAFMDAERNFLKARGDVPHRESPREVSFCAYTILDDEVLVVNDAAADPRFADNPLVTGGYGMRFYAGAPLITPSGHRIGTVCIFDTEPRAAFAAEDERDLRELASIVTDHLEMRLIVGNVHDEIETRRAAEAAAYRLAYHDDLTGLPNRAHLHMVLRDGLPFAPRGVLAAFAADLDDFKAVNDTLGHHAGDELLRRTAQAILATVGGQSFVARVSGDEFIAILDAEDADSAMGLATGLVEQTGAPFQLAGHMLSNGVSLGVAVDSAGTRDLDALLRNADLALCEAKANGRKRAVAYADWMGVRASRRAKLARDLGGAIARGEISVNFQPIHLPTQGAMIGVEALAAWHHPELGAVSPLEFIGLAEETEQILTLGDYILRTAVAAAGAWDGIFVSVNLSPVQFRLADLAGEVAAILQEARFPAHRLQLEVTESVLLHDLAAAKRQLEALRDTGVHLALDDFGTGYSSLNYIGNLPFNKLKIDRAFVHGAASDPKRLAIIQHVVALARDLDMRVTAEGIETEGEALLLTAAGCTSLQGFLFSPPVPAAEISRRLGLARSAA